MCWHVYLYIYTAFPEGYTKNLNSNHYLITITRSTSKSGSRALRGKGTLSHHMFLGLHRVHLMEKKGKWVEKRRKTYFNGCLLNTGVLKRGRELTNKQTISKEVS